MKRGLGAAPVLVGTFTSNDPAGINYAGGNPCFSEVTGQNIPGCVQPGAVSTPPTPAVPSWVWWLAGGLVLAFFLGSD